MIWCQGAQNIGLSNHKLRGRQIEVGYVQIGALRPKFRYISETVQDTDTVTMQS